MTSLRMAVGNYLKAYDAWNAYEGEHMDGEDCLWTTGVDPRCPACVEEAALRDARDGALDKLRGVWAQECK